ncbi:MAG: ATP-binding protein [Hyphomicrobiaceae bacterium]
MAELARSRAIPAVGLVLMILAFAAFGGLSPMWAGSGVLVVLGWFGLGFRAGGDCGHLGEGSAHARLGEGRGELILDARQVLEAFPDAALLLDGNRNILVANAAARDVFPVKDGVYVSQVSRAPELLEAIDKLFETRQTQTFTMRLLGPVERHFAGTAAPLAERGHRPGGPAAMIVLNDRTEVDQQAQLRADFVANASHELRTPLASLKGFVETLRGPAKDDAGAREQFLGIMQGQADRMARLIDDLLSLSRVEMRQHVAPTGKVDLVSIAKEAVSSLASLADEAKVALQADFPNQPVMALGDHGELMQVVQNLLQNAVKYGREGGFARVRVQDDGDWCRLAVSDDGAGIAPQHLPRLTERFYRVSAKESRDRGGTGLGLAIVKHIVNRHRGELQIESRPGEGSTFTVLLRRSEY